MSKKINVAAALKNAALVGAGAVGANAAEKLLKKTVLKNATVKPAVMGAGKIVVGALAPELMKGKNKAAAEAIGNGIIAAGAIQMQQAMFPSLAGVAGIDDVLSGIGADEEYYVEGLDDDDSVSGVEEAYTLSGVDDDEDSY